MAKNVIENTNFTRFDHGGGWRGTYDNPPLPAQTFPSMLSYIGAARLPAGPQGISKLAYIDNPFCYDSINDSLFIGGNGVTVAEFSLPTLVNSLVYDELNTATVTQNFVATLDRAPSGNPETLDRVTGLYVADGELIVNAVMFYDGSASNTLNTIVIEDKDDLAGSTVKGLYSINGNTHAAGWITDVPLANQAAVGGDVIFGYAANMAIVSRFSIGPTAFAVTLADLLDHPSNTGSYGSIPLLDYSLANQINGVNKDVINHVWQPQSRSWVGFIIPGTDIYAVVGRSEGNILGTSYKRRNDAGSLAGGYSANKVADAYNYYWLFSLTDLLAVKAGALNPWEVVSYEYGPMTLPFQEVTNPSLVPDGYSGSTGAWFDSATSRLYIILERSGLNDRVLVVYEVTAP